MKSAIECVREAAKCERMAEDAPNDFERRTLLHAAKEWRGLAREVQVTEAADTAIILDPR